MRRLIAIAALVTVPAPAYAAYSPPLTEVRIDRDVIVHTPSLVYVTDQRTSSTTDLELTGYGAQYIGQFEWTSGYGLQIGASIGPGSVDGTVSRTDPIAVDTSGFWVGGQLRAYKMLWKSEVDEAVERPSAITAFVNVRALYYQMSGTKEQRVDLNFSTVTGGIGAMAEISLGDYISLCPYAWLTPGVSSRLDFDAETESFVNNGGPTLRTPFLIGIDLWVYPFPPVWDAHISLSVLASLVDTEGDNQTFAAVVGYTF